MLHRGQLSRRTILRNALTAGAVFAAPNIVRAAVCEVTPAEVEGPFYMNDYDRKAPLSNNNNDLTQIPGAERAADGEVIYVGGQVTDGECRPVKGATVEIWQSCVTGRYAHVRDPNPAPIDPYFRYSGESLTDDEGRYSFKTIKPGAYPLPGGLARTPHIHFRVVALSPVLTTQMYFAGEPLNEKDILLNHHPKAEQKRVVIEPSTRPGSYGEENYYEFALTIDSFPFSIQPTD